MELHDIAGLFSDMGLNLHVYRGHAYNSTKVYVLEDVGYDHLVEDERG